MGSSSKVALTQFHMKTKPFDSGLEPAMSCSEVTLTGGTWISSAVRWINFASSFALHNDSSFTGRTLVFDDRIVVDIEESRSRYLACTTFP